MLEGHTEKVYSVAFSPDSRKLASGASDRTVRVWNMEEYTATKKYAIVPHLNLNGANFKLAINSLETVSVKRTVSEF